MLNRYNLFIKSQSAHAHSPPCSSQWAIIGDNVQTGINSMINAGTIIGNDVFIGAGAIARGEIKPNARVM